MAHRGATGLLSTLYEMVLRPRTYIQEGNGAGRSGKRGIRARALMNFQPDDAASEEPYQSDSAADQIEMTIGSTKLQNR